MSNIALMLFVGTLLIVYGIVARTSHSLYRQPARWRLATANASLTLGVALLTVTLVVALHSGALEPR